MPLPPPPSASAADAFLLAYPALFSIVNPIGGALIFSEMTAERAHPERQRIAAHVGFYSLMVLLVSLWAGSYVLNFFGISLGALRLAGGLVVAVRAWDVLNAPDRHREQKQRQAAEAPSSDDPAFFPLTMPFTTGPGTVAVAIALSAERPSHGIGALPFLLGLTAAALAMAVSIWIAYRSAERLMSLLGETGARVFTRVIAFLLLCIGVQIMASGALDILRPVLG
ncbi:MAG TPA: MarC family protein [Acetobacteraceae bacterium]|nr:MarC family protein [Acetobacteraceae bacterium]